MLGEPVDLRLVQVGDRLCVGCPVPELDEEALVVLQPVWRANDGVIQAIRVEVLEHLPRSLLEVRRRHDHPVLLGRQPDLECFPLRRLRDE